MKTTTNETLTKIMALRDEAERLIETYAKANLLTNPSVKIIEMMNIAARKIKQNIQEIEGLKATLPIQ